MTKYYYIYKKGDFMLFDVHEKFFYTPAGTAGISGKKKQK